MYRIAICDDDENLRETLRSMVVQLLTDKGIESRVQVFPSAEALLAAIEQDASAFDLLFLDILMEEMNGMELAHTLRKRNLRMSIVFLTICQDYLREGYRVQPLDYLLKPVNPEELKQVLELDLRLNHMNCILTLQSGARQLRLTVRDIYYIESMNRRVVVHTAKEAYTVSRPFGQLLEQLPGECFCRCHRCYAVNLSWVQRIERTQLVLQNEETIPVGRKYYQLLQNALVHILNR